MNIRTRRLIRVGLGWRVGSLNRAQFGKPRDAEGYLRARWTLQISNKGEPPCHYPSERCRARAHVLVVANGRQLLHRQQIAASANNQSCNTPHVLPAVLITVVKFSRFSPDAGFNRKARSFGKSRAS